MTPDTRHNTSGLTSEEVLRSRTLHGSNVITPPREESPWRLLAEKFRDPIIVVLLVAALLSLGVAFVDRDFTETIGIICAILLATCVGFWFELDAMRRFRELNRVNDDTPVKVRRDGQMQLIPRCDVVVGDVVCIESGETVPADGRLTEAVSLRVDESTLTGEPETGKSTDPSHFDAEATYPTDMVLRGTTVTEGYGVFTVTAVGDATEMGGVSRQASVATGGQTPLSRQLSRLSQLIGKVGIALAVAIFAALAIRAAMVGNIAAGDWVAISKVLLHTFMVAVAIIVMAVPEGLPMSITLSLAMSMRRMLKTNNLVRRMHACETMGAVTVLCTDKTGTLTMNRMTVERWYAPAGSDKAMTACAVAVNSTAFLSAAGEPIGNPTEGALLQYIQSQQFQYLQLRSESAIADRHTFSTERKYMATLADTPHGRMLCVKGAPEVVLPMCGNYDAEQTARVTSEYQSHAMRTIAIAYALTDATACTEAMQRGGMTLAAVAGIADPVREDVAEAVAKCTGAGIAVKIVTGDNAATAVEIARRIGLWDDAADSPCAAVTGAEFAAMSDEEALARVRELKIMSRARPSDKQRLVTLLQRCGEVVAVTGDGTNDAPALNFANVGLSMGSGTSVAKDASDITLLDDSFASIVTAVMWGRSLYRNIQRFVLFQLTINLAAIVTVFVGAVCGTELPLTVVQILWVNLIMDTFAAMAMASLPPNAEVMRDRPRPRDEFIITPAMTRTILACGGVFIAVLLAMLFGWMRSGGVTAEHLTIFFSVFVFMQVWNMFNAKGFESLHNVFSDLRRTPAFLGVAATIAAGQIAIVEFGGEIFRCVPLPFGTWCAIIGLTSLIAFGGEAIRTLKRRH